MSVKTAFESGFEKGLKDLSVKLAQELGIEDSVEILKDLRSKIAEMSGTDIGLATGGVLGAGGGLALDKLVAPRVGQYQEELARLNSHINDISQKIKEFSATRTGIPLDAPRDMRAAARANYLRNEFSRMKNVWGRELSNMPKESPITSKIHNLFGQNSNNIRTLGKSLQGAGAAGLLALLGKKIYEKPRFTE